MPFAAKIRIIGRKTGRNASIQFRELQLWMCCKHVRNGRFRCAPANRQCRHLSRQAFLPCHRGHSRSSRIPHREDRAAASRELVRGHTSLGRMPVLLLQGKVPARRPPQRRGKLWRYVGSVSRCPIQRRPPGGGGRSLRFSQCSRFSSFEFGQRPKTELRE